MSSFEALCRRRLETRAPASGSVRALRAWLVGQPEGFGVGVALAAPRGALGAVELWVRAAETVGDGCALLSRGASVLHPALRVSLEVRGTEAVLGVATAGEPHGFGPEGTELLLVLVARWLREMAPAFRVRRVETVHAASKALLTALAQPTHTKVRANAALVFDAASLRSSSSSADAAVRDVLAEQVRFLTPPPERDVVHRAGEVVRERLAARKPVGVAVVAKSLGTSARSLQRALGEAGTSFQSVLAQARFHEAEALLSDPAPGVAEVAERLGYADTRAFTRAFKQWSARSPSAYRAAHLPAPPPSVFGPWTQASAFEALFQRALGGDATLAAKLREQGVDVARLEVRYPTAVWCACVAVARQHRFPRLSAAKGERALGRLVAEGFFDTLIGRVLGVGLPLLGPARVLHRLPRSFAAVSTDVGIEVSDHPDGHRVQFDEAHPLPELVAGVLEVALARAGFEGRIDVESSHARGYVLRVH